MKYPHTNEFYNHFISSMNRQNYPFCLLQMCYNECPNFFNEFKKFWFSAYLNATVPHIVL